MVRIDDAIIARIKKAGEVFEILVDCDAALEFKAGKRDDLLDVLATEGIFRDVKQGLHASEHSMHHVFQTDDTSKIAAIIIKEGDIQLTAEHKNRLRDEKWKQIVQFIHRHAIDAKSGLPHPAARIESAMQEAKVRVDAFRSVDSQVKDVMHALRPLLAIKFEVRELALHIPAQYAGNAYSSVKRLAKVLRDDWQNDGSLRLVVEIPAGMQEQLEKELNNLTKGDLRLEVLNKR